MLIRDWMIKSAHPVSIRTPGLQENHPEVHGNIPDVQHDRAALLWVAARIVHEMPIIEDNPQERDSKIELSHNIINNLMKSPVGAVMDCHGNFISDWELFSPSPLTKIGKSIHMAVLSTAVGT